MTLNQETGPESGTLIATPSTAAAGSTSASVSVCEWSEAPVELCASEHFKAIVFIVETDALASSIQVPRLDSNF